MDIEKNTTENVAYGFLREQKAFFDSFAAQNKSFKFCEKCQHKNVCGKKDSEEPDCVDYFPKHGHECYGNIYEMFDPIFEWMEYHYPSTDIQFVVEKSKATLYMEHKVTAFSKTIRQMVKSAESFVKDNGKGRDT